MSSLIHSSDKLSFLVIVHFLIWLDFNSTISCLTANDIINAGFGWCSSNIYNFKNMFGVILETKTSNKQMSLSIWHIKSVTRVSARWLGSWGFIVARGWFLSCAWLSCFGWFCSLAFSSGGWSLCKSRNNWKEKFLKNSNTLTFHI